MNTSPPSSMPTQRPSFTDICRRLSVQSSSPSLNTLLPPPKFPTPITNSSYHCRVMPPSVKEAKSSEYAVDNMSSICRCFKYGGKKIFGVLRTSGLFTSASP
eukprot:Filipodium_phascolosomae@DN3401_c0_g1_i1.p1